MEKMTFNIIDWCALSRNLSTKEAWKAWAIAPKKTFDTEGDYPKSIHIPMMQARRMSIPTRLACDIFLTLTQGITIDAAVFVSEHGELERSYKVIKSMLMNDHISPTDFSMSVHNCAAGMSTIIAKNSVELSSIAAGKDSFHQALFEVHSFFAGGANKVLLLDFNGEIPHFYQAHGIDNQVAYACGFLFEKGDMFSCQGMSKHFRRDQNNSGQREIAVDLPQSLEFLAAFLSQKEMVTITGEAKEWQWIKNKE